MLRPGNPHRTRRHGHRDHDDGRNGDRAHTRGDHGTLPPTPRQGTVRAGHDHHEHTRRTEQRANADRQPHAPQRTQQRASPPPPRPQDRQRADAQTGAVQHRHHPRREHSPPQLRDLPPHRQRRHPHDVQHHRGRNHTQDDRPPDRPPDHPPKRHREHEPGDPARQRRRHQQQPNDQRSLPPPHGGHHRRRDGQASRRPQRPNSSNHRNDDRNGGDGDGGDHSSKSATRPDQYGSTIGAGIGPFDNRAKPTGRSDNGCSITGNPSPATPINLCASNPFTIDCSS